MIKVEEVLFEHRGEFNGDEAGRLLRAGHTVHVSGVRLKHVRAGVSVECGKCGAARVLNEPMELARFIDKHTREASS